MMTMDVKAVPWIGGMCQKFEALCVEVDEAIYEDTVKYVGNQMRNVGDTVKKFYSEVVQDLLASSSQDSVDKDALVTPSHDTEAKFSAKTKIENETESVGAASDQVVKDSTAAANNTLNSGVLIFAEKQFTLEDLLNHNTELSFSNQASFVNKDFNGGQKSEHKSFSDWSSVGTCSTKDFGEEFTCEGALNEQVQACSGSSDLICKESSAVEENKGKEIGEEISGGRMEEHQSAFFMKSQAKLSFVGDTPVKRDDSVSPIKTAIETTTTQDEQNCLELTEEISDAGVSNDLLAHEVKDGGAQKQVVYLSEPCSSSKLEESCVLVENYEHCSKSTLGDVQKSYKKKIREVFSSRKWSKSKKDQQQLAAWYEEKCSKKSASTSIKHGESQTSETFESEWEFL